MKKWFGAFVVLAMVVSGCATDKGTWQDARRTNTIQAYEAYLAKYPNGAFKNEAGQQLGYLVEEQDYRQAKRVGNMESYEAFLRKHPNGSFAYQARQEISGIENNSWRSAEVTGTVEAIDLFLNKFPESRYKDEAEKKKAEIIENEAWAKAQEQNTIASYDRYLASFPNGTMAFAAKLNRAKLAEEQTWQKAQQENRFSGYSEYLSSYPKGRYAEEARKAIPKFYFLSDAQISQIDGWQRTKDPKALRLDNVEKLLFNGANCIDGDANWTNRTRGRNIYDILKGYNNRLLGEGMRRVVLMQINRLRVLFLVVKLGVPGTQKVLNDLLMEYGDKEMAEDYLNCGSKELHEGGAAWASANGYFIQTGWGSNRVNWGSF